MDGTASERRRPFRKQFRDQGNQAAPQLEEAEGKVQDSGSHICEVLGVTDQFFIVSRANDGRFKSRLAVEVAALLTWSAVGQGDRLGGLLFDGRQRWEQRPTLGAKPALHFLEQLVEHGRPGPASPGAGENPAALNDTLSSLRRVARPGSLVAIISDFRGLDERCLAHLAQLGRHSEVVLVFLYDALEHELPPPGRYRITDGRQTRWIDTADPDSRTFHRSRFQQRRERLRQISSRHRYSSL